MLARLHTTIALLSEQFEMCDSKHACASLLDEDCRPLLAGQTCKGVRD